MGTKIVPVEPTYQMCEAGGFKWEAGEGFPTKYRAMLAAAPSVVIDFAAIAKVIGELRFQAGKIYNSLGPTELMELAETLQSALEQKQ